MPTRAGLGRVQVVLPHMPEPSFSGTKNVMAALVPCLRGLGWLVEVVQLQAVTQPGDLQAVRRQAQTAATDLTAGWQSTRPDIVHVEYPDPNGAAVMTAARKAVSVVTGQFHQLHLHVPLVQRPRVLAMVCASLAGCDAVFSESALGHGLLHQHGVTAAVLLPRGIDRGHFHPGRRDLALRGRWGAAGDEPVVIWFGRMVPVKRLDRFIAAAEAVRHAHSRSQVVVVGDGSEAAMVQRCLPWAHHLGAVHGDQLAATIASADVFAFPSPDEPFGVAALEAAASGVAVVAARTGAAHEILAPDGALVSDPGDPLSFIQATVQAAGDPALRARLAAAASLRLAGLEWPAIAARWSAVWQDLLARRRPG